MADKQPHLNGAFYGPAVPPPAKTYHRHGHGRGCACCLLTTFLKFLIAIVVVLGVAVLVFWLVFRPNKLKFDVTGAQLTRFNVSGNQLHYDLALNLTVRNPNKRIGVYYDVIEASPYYKDQRLNTQWLTPFYQGHKTTSVLSPQFDGQQIVIFAGDKLTEFNGETLAGVFEVDVKIRLRLRLKVGAVRIGKFSRFKVDVNARENRLTGCAVICDGISVLVVEGGSKSIKRYAKLMLRRINWAASVKEEEEEENDDKPLNKCSLVWQGSVAKSSFNRFSIQECMTEAAARKIFADAGVGHYWDFAINFSDDQL